MPYFSFLGAVPISPQERGLAESSPRTMGSLGTVWRVARGNALGTLDAMRPQALVGLVRMLRLWGQCLSVEGLLFCSDALLG